MTGATWPSVISTAVLAILVTLCATSAMAVEQAQYDVVAADGDFEVRHYGTRIVAETVLSGKFTEVGNEGFRRLVAYIRGANQTQSNFAMTAPVTQATQSEEIDMTAPVTQKAQAGAYRITFLMPSRYTLSNLPTPDDPRIVLVEEPE